MFITFEGPDGSGKTTQIALLAEELTRRGYSVLTTREPGGTPIGEQIREVLHNRENTTLAPRAEVLLFAASRAQLITEVIRPALSAGRVVISDRFYDSTFAYQGYGHGLDLDVLRTLTAFVTGGLTPDLTIYIRIDAEEGLRRRQYNDDAEWTRMDALEAAFHKRVQAGYEALIEAEPARWEVIDGGRAPEAVQADVVSRVVARLEAENQP